MILGMGIDLIANRGVEQELARGDWQLGDGIFTSREISRCGRNRKPALCYAACFAAKEAALKALGISVGDLSVMREVEIELDSNGKCTVVLYDRVKSESEHIGVKHITVSIASSKQQTGAMVILES